MNIHKRSENGSITVMALLILVVLTVLGVTITRTTNLDLQISTNELLRKQNFYIAEAGVNREAAEIGRGNYEVADVYQANTDLADENSDSLPGPAHAVVDAKGNSRAYNFDIEYLGFFMPPKGYSVTQFSRYDYQVEADTNNVGVRSRYYKIGPKTS